MSKPIIPALALAGALLMAGSDATRTEGCLFEPPGEGRVAEIIDGRSFRLTDGREIRLAGIETAADETTRPNRVAALTALIAGRDVTLFGPDDAPDRYGRQTAIVVLGSTETPVQALLLRQGDALVSAEIVDKNWAADLGQAEAEARQAKRGVWADPTVTKNAESSGDILSGVGRFAVVEGIVLSARPGRQLISTSDVTGHGALRRLFQNGQFLRLSQLESRLSRSKVDEFASGGSLRRDPDRGLRCSGSGRSKYWVTSRFGWRHT